MPTQTEREKWRIKEYRRHGDEVKFLENDKPKRKTHTVIKGKIFLHRNVEKY